MYFQLYDILHQYIYGADVVLTNWQDLVLTQLSTMGVIFVISLPFVLVWKVIRIWV